jgi:hypothetical protein
LAFPISTAASGTWTYTYYATSTGSDSYTIQIIGRMLFGNGGYDDRKSGTPRWFRRRRPSRGDCDDTHPDRRLNVEPMAWLTDVLERIVFTREIFAYQKHRVKRLRFQRQ